MSEKPVLLLCDHGLANRLRALAQHVAARGRSARQIDMIWGPSLSPHGLGLAGCGGNASTGQQPCPFSRLFEPLPARINVSILEATSSAEVVALLRRREQTHAVECAAQEALPLLGPCGLGREGGEGRALI